MCGATRTQSATCLHKTPNMRWGGSLTGKSRSAMDDLAGVSLA